MCKMPRKKNIGEMHPDARITGYGFHYYFEDI